jgi:hypothetical protein
VDGRTKKELFAVAADLQRTLGRKTSLNDAIHHLIQLYRGAGRDVQLMLSLFGSLRPSSEARKILADLRKEEDQHLERTARKHSA